MQKSLLIKVAAIALLTLLLLVPITMIDSLVAERRQRQEEVVRDVAASYATEQRVVGPVLVLPWQRSVRAVLATAVGAPAVTQLQREHGRMLVFPEQLRVSGAIDTDLKQRGLFTARIYQWKGHLEGSFRLPEALEPPPPAEGEVVELNWGTPYLSLAISDPRGIVGTPTLDWNGRSIPFARGSLLRLEARGIHAELAGESPHGEQHFALDLPLRGTESLAIVPLGGDNQIALSSDWRHPSFGGRFLPEVDSQQVGAEGFAAQWSVSALAADAAQQVRRSEGGDCGSGCTVPLDQIELRLIEPVDIYTLSDRALKYAHLFIVLGFSAFFIFEVVRRLRMHPIQYLFVGLALAVFFLLLISLSEHVDFALAYAGAALACSALLTGYLGSVLGGFGRGAGFGGGFLALFAALYVLLQSEDNALVMGSVLVFGLLSAAMMVTRSVDWYALGTRIEARSGE